MSAGAPITETARPSPAAGQARVWLPEAPHATEHASGSHAFDTDPAGGGIARNAPAQRREPRRLLGLRISAITETLTFLGLMLALGAALGIPDRFAGVSPHPFWIIVLLISSYYGASEGLMAAAFATIALLLGNLSEQAFGESLSSWLVRETGQPVLWFVAAIILGEIRDGLHRRKEALVQTLKETRSQAAAITESYEELLQCQIRLEEHIAAQTQTVNRMYLASRAIERQSAGQVLLGVLDVTRAVLAPTKFSLFLLNGPELEAAVSEGWGPDDPFQRHISSSSTLFQKIVTRRQFLLVADPADEASLDQQGFMAGPLVCRSTDEVFGMLKIEEIGFAELNFTTVQNFRIVCEWIGAAFSNARTFEQLRNGSYFEPGSGLLPASFFDRQRDVLVTLARQQGFEASCLYLALETPPAQKFLAHLEFARFLARRDDILTSAAQCFEHGRDGWDYAVLLPYGSDTAEIMGARIAAQHNNEFAASRSGIRVRFMSSPLPAWQGRRNLAFPR